MRLNKFFQILILGNILLISYFIFFRRYQLQNFTRKPHGLLLDTNSYLLETEGVSYLPRQNADNIFLIWFGENYPLVYFKCLETLVFHHPKADVLIFSNELNESLVEPFWKKGYPNVRVVRFNLTILGRDKPGFDFVIKATKLLRNETLDYIKLSRVHLSDFLRYLLVFTYGGFYIDSDSFVIKNFLKFKNSISVSDNFAYKCSKKVFNAPKVKNFTCISNSMFHFERNHGFLRDALELYDVAWVKYQSYGPGGASMLMNFIDKYIDKVNFYSSKEFMCQNLIMTSRTIMESSDKRVKHALENCFTLQILGAGAHNLTIKNFEKTLMGRIYSRSKIF
ncbi:unnamed protein product [Brachionus calyciflorus]|uniref:Alpha-1,4-N-acetylglucosaminyltransferase n=1 Tax=Brachionus calyciflorus TaxID=104777 RepID=A0A814B6J5_9BILA|nr:unnamed protein product [Brachionus calyciflorus]